MKTKDIKIKFDVPDGYFEELQDRLSDVPRKSGRPSFAAQLKPYLYLAAAFAVLIGVGTAVLDRTVPKSLSVYEELGYADLLPTYGSEYYFEDVSDSEMTDDDIIDYLIHSRVSPERIEYVANYEKH